MVLITDMFPRNDGTHEGNSQRMWEIKAWNTSRRCGQILPQFMNLTKSKTMYILLFVFTFCFQASYFERKKLRPAREFCRETLGGTWDGDYYRVQQKASN